MGKGVNTDFRPAAWESSKEEERPKLEYLVTNKKTPPVELYLTAFASACSAEIVGYPFDVCKTRMQIQGEMVSKTGSVAKYRGLLATAMGIVREEGLLKLYGGISAMILRHSLYSGIKMLTYDYMRDKMIVPDKDGNRQLSFAGSCISGVVAGATASILTNPTELIKIQMQMEGQRRLKGEPPRIHNVFQALTSVYRKGGVVGLWQGTVPHTWRSALVSVGGRRELLRFVQEASDCRA
ncbi:mitochondrial uncoupling protein 4 isoform X2 [Drosophila biarmipes]|uniref:mitochondrial uncoupling protein 4 isoform X2 n=1 Tax=Drosophila biarmipes TaxID=125945 RepID=UPI0007E78E44|nr:mitochondrial uncoupling protein 4 isoform X2 [Drosophila biarmipes]